MKRLGIVGVLAGGLLLIAAASSLASRGAHAQSALSTQHTLRVEGVYRQRVVPDLASVSVGAQETAASAAQAELRTEDAVRAIVKAVEKLGIPASDIRTQVVNLAVIQGVSCTASCIRGYRGSTLLSVRVAPASNAGKVIDAAVAAGANQVEGLSFRVSDARKLQLAGYSGAMADARAQAQAIARDAGVTLGPVLSVDATGSTRVPVFHPFVTAAAAATSLPVGEQRLTTRLLVVYSLVP